MTKLRLQFLLFFLLFAAAAGFLLFNSYRQMAGEEKALWVSQGEQVFDQVQAKISDFLNREDARSFAEYRYYQAIPSGQKAPRVISPLATQAPEDDPRGLLGYFQIDPDGSFSTPYLPQGEGSPPSDAGQRKERERNLERLTRFLRTEVLKDARAAKESEKITAAASSPPPQLAETPLSLTPNVYPKPVQKKKAPAPIFKEEAEKPVAPEKADGVYQKLERRKVASSEVELKAFEEQAQKASPASPPAAENAPAEREAQDLAKQEVPPTADGPAPRAERNLDLLEGSADRKGFSLGRGGGPGGAPKTTVSPAPPASSGLGSQAPRRLEPLKRPEPMKRDAEPPEEASVLIDPFQARAQPDGNLIFFRKVWLNQKLYLQGFALNTIRFYGWLMAETFENSEISNFAWAGLEQGDTLLARSNSSNLSSPAAVRILFERVLGYPLNRFTWRVHYDELPKLAGRFYLNLFAGLIALLGTVGLFFIYRSATAQVRLSQKRQDFVSAVTHELKTPLTSIRMLSEMLQEGWVKDDSKKEEYYRHLHKETSRLSGLIDNVLQLARLEKQTYRLKQKVASPEADFDEIAEELKKLAATKGFRLVASRPDALPAVAYDPDALKEVLLVFADNSLKFAEGGGDKTMEMVLQRQADHLLWEWRDRGPGVPPAELKKIFEKFYRVENEMTRTTKGTGIGLAMAKMIAEAMGAKIEAENRNEGGLTLRLAFPVVRPT